MTIAEVNRMDIAARFNRPISRVDVRRLCATVRALQRRAAL